tara:strand:- start:798 stop:1037 length:240 start_codon:yes stop_codon:yes gene_type:complete
MRAKRRCMHGKRLRRSPMRKDYDFSKYKDYSPEATKGMFGDKLAKAITPENTLVGYAKAFAPVGKVGKVAKLAYNIFKS